VGVRKRLPRTQMLKEGDLSERGGSGEKALCMKTTRRAVEGDFRVASLARGLSMAAKPAKLRGRRANEERESNRRPSVGRRNPRANRQSSLRNFHGFWGVGGGGGLWVWVVGGGGGGGFGGCLFVGP